MARLSNRMTKYEAPQGFVYDYKEPKDDNHLLVKFLFLSKNDDINNYVLVKDEKNGITRKKSCCRWIGKKWYCRL